MSSAKIAAICLVVFAPIITLPRGETRPGRAAALGAGGSSIRFVDITRQAGISFVHNSGAFGKKYLPETMGSGCAFIDYDRDGKPDILLINGKDFAGRHTRRTTMKLYRNNGNGTFTDVTAKAGLNVELYGMG